MQVNGKRVVITGAGSGLGQAMVFLLLKKGARVAMVDIHERGLDETREQAGDLADRLSKHVMSITDQESVQALPGEVIEAHGTVDGLINNAGIIQPFIPVKDLEMSMIERVMNINFMAACI